LPINFTPVRGRILICDFDLACVRPEIDKPRRVVVISPRSYNHRHGNGPGRCTVIPLTGTEPGGFLTPAYVPFRANAYETLTKPTWALCCCVMTVSHERLDRVRVRGRPSEEILRPDDIARLRVGLQHGLGFR